MKHGERIQRHRTARQPRANNPPRFLTCSSPFALSHSLIISLAPLHTPPPSSSPSLYLPAFHPPLLFCQRASPITAEPGLTALPWERRSFGGNKMLVTRKSSRLSKSQNESIFTMWQESFNLRSECARSHVVNRDFNKWSTEKVDLVYFYPARSRRRLKRIFLKFGYKKKKETHTVDRAVVYLCLANITLQLYIAKRDQNMLESSFLETGGEIVLAVYYDQVSGQ